LNISECDIAFVQKINKQNAIGEELFTVYIFASIT